MKKSNKWKLLVSGAIILSPVVAGLILWEQLPPQLATHWGADGIADGFSGKALAVFGIPLIMLFAQMVTVFFVERNNQANGQDRKILNMIYWIMPATSVMVCTVTYGSALGREIRFSSIFFLFFSLLFLFIGNYLPKTKRNRTLGVRVKWALLNDENWNRTHRFTGKLWFYAGLLSLPALLLPETTALSFFGILLLVLILCPLLFSFLTYKKQLREGTWTEDQSLTGSKEAKAGTAFALLIIAAAAFLMFSGEISFSYNEKSFTVDSAYWHSLTVDYASIESIEMRNDVAPGLRTRGFGSAKLSMGMFQNEEFGSYTRYSYTKCKESVVISSGGNILVLSGKNEKETREIFQILSGKAYLP